MERAVSSAGIGRTDKDGDAKPTARSLLKFYKDWRDGALEKWSNGSYKAWVFLDFRDNAALQYSNTPILQLRLHPLQWWIGVRAY